MIPTWVLTTLVIIAGCAFAVFAGSSLPIYDYYGLYIVTLAAVCTIAAVTNNFPMLLAVGAWMPFELPVSIFRNFPTIVLVIGWLSLVLFFRMCLTGTIQYIKSFNLYFLIVFAWVPIRFLMNPVYKFGNGVAGGEGVSGAKPYLMYAVAAVLLVLIGGILNTRQRLVAFMRWCLLFVFIIGFGFLICAFIPATGPWLYSMGIFAAGSMGDGILRIVQLPAYGFFLIQAALCPNLFRLKTWHCALLLMLGSAMMIVGGNRSTIMASLFAIPVILILRRSTHVLAFSIGLFAIGILMLRLSVDSSSLSSISPLTRSLGIFDSRIDKASGGTESADWRYAVWDSGIKKIMENPVVGKGFGNLPKHLDLTSTEVMQSTDFEVILAGGEAHNGFITAAYGFGIPFMVALTIGLLLRMLSQFKSALQVDRHDLELRDLYALVTSMYPAYFVNIYTAFDMSVIGLWVYVGMGFVMDNLPRSPDAVDVPSMPQQPKVLAQTAYPSGPSWAFAGKPTSKRK